MRDFLSHEQPDADEQETPRRHAAQVGATTPAHDAAPLAELLTQLQHTHGNTYVQRLVGEMREATPHEPEAATERVEPLDTATRAAMEAAFGEDFGDVRVHTGGRAAETTDALGARAFTHGEDIHFGRDGFRPEAREDRETLAHELAHVAQQRVRRDEYADEHASEQASRHAGEHASEHTGGRASKQASKQASATRESAEREAEEVARLVAAGERARVTQHADASSRYMQTPPAGQRTPTPAPTPAPTPPAQAQRPGSTVNVTTPAMSDAIVRLLTDRAYEAERINLWAAFPQDRWRWLAQYFALLFPAAMAELLRQRPANVPRVAFLQAAFTQVWSMLGATLIAVIDQRRQQEKRFRERTDRERQRMLAGDISAPTDDEL